MRIEPATADRFDDVATVLNPTGREQACWCMHWRLPPKEDASRREDYLRELAARDPAPGLLAYDGDTVAGWLGLAPKSASRMLQRSRVLPPGDPESWPTTWAVMCFTVRPGYRRRGVARALLEGAVEYARAHGARVIEGYPVEPDPGRRVPVSAAFVGTVGLFEQAGFERVAMTSATSGRLPRWVLRRELDPA
ncbi:GNAT family N-acetyltransferase [Isoptericola variabilis]|uniref:GCN5-related N-acetyltransferase n=1 Tax=Isoptericola variabilis (strain 225) TaxID=743718 RepID=F6FTQ3_ISOV2|nr:GNAT family N-acetyltransferase [Isoptericola variabilis]AEG44180.1 GCN5-related N-acetyltransferase [Isoptericola variabilis 225]TWH28505.1 Acetyltransferases [Isoptericola variabilis J7]